MRRFGAAPVRAREHSGFELRDRRHSPVFIAGEIKTLDASPLQTTPVEDQYRILLDELRRHDPVLADRPRVVVLLKADLPETAVAASGLQDRLGEPVHVVSAVTGEGVPALLHAVADRIDLAVREAPERRGFVLHRPVPEGFSVEHDGEVWVVSGRAAERAVGFDDLTKPETADLAAARLKRAGVDEALRKAGAQPGDDVRIGTIVFEFRDDEDA